jgi:hypothetical protein
MPDNMEHVQALKILLFINMGQVRYRAWLPYFSYRVWPRMINYLNHSKIATACNTGYVQFYLVAIHQANISHPLVYSYQKYEGTVIQTAGPPSIFHSSDLCCWFWCYFLNLHLSRHIFYPVIIQKQHQKI